MNVIAKMRTRWRSNRGRNWLGERVIGAQTREYARLPEGKARSLSALLFFVLSEPFAVADGVYKADQDE